jgi:acyl phosphate:glycerol-3-phosphate acyltransferase
MIIKERDQSRVLASALFPVKGGQRPYADRSVPSPHKVGLLRMTRFLATTIASYLLGSIPFGYILVRIFHGEDVRQSGSGNIGATNVARKSPVLGAITLLLDAAKGAAAVALGLSFSPTAIGYMDYLHRHLSLQQLRLATLYGALAAFSAIVGHMFPLWLKFRGGKGVATALGSFALLAPKAVVVAAAVFLVIVLIFRYVSLGSIIAVASFPVLAWFFREYGASTGALVFLSMSSLLIIGRHHANIRRLLAGTEHRFGSKRNPDNTSETARFEDR